MVSSGAARIRDIVYVIGAGFSAGLGYPLTNRLLIDVWTRLDKADRDDLAKVIRFHHPAFNPKRKTTYPNIEQLLTEIKVNIDLFRSSRPSEGTFKKETLVNIQNNLLYEITKSFHVLYKEAIKHTWLKTFIKRIKYENAAIISFNWDLILDNLLFDGEINSDTYGLQGDLWRRPVLLKPHGSLNWYDSDDIKNVKADRRIVIFTERRKNN